MLLSLFGSGYLVQIEKMVVWYKYSEWTVWLLCSDRMVNLDFPWNLIKPNQTSTIYPILRRGQGCMQTNPVPVSVRSCLAKGVYEKESLPKKSEQFEKKWEEL